MKCKAKFHSDNYYKHDPIRRARAEETHRKVKASGLTYTDYLQSLGDFKTNEVEENDNNTCAARQQPTRSEQRTDVG